MKILVSGGCGYIGSHACFVLQSQKHDLVVLDNLSNSIRVAIDRLKILTDNSIELIQGDIRNENLLDTLFKKHSFDAVMHFAGLKSVAESIQKPLSYYDVNVHGTISLCKSMVKAKVHKLIFSSSCTVYGDPLVCPVPESYRESLPVNPYGRSKMMAERVLEDLSVSNPELSVGVLRYFNPVGAHESGLIGEDPRGTPANLFPFISQVMIGRRPKLIVHGNDYNTKDGTGIRDYIHVMDLVEGHVSALDKLQVERGYNVWNLGTGKGYSVLEVVNMFEQVLSVKIPYIISSRRPGDISCNYADVTKASKELGWRPAKNLTAMVQDACNWQSKNPYGYQSPGNHPLG
jgi:UDP-glucose 4-epimerase